MSDQPIQIIDGELVLYKRPHSNTDFYYARIKLPTTGKWKKFSTKTNNQKAATDVALKEYNKVLVLIDNGLSPEMKRFKDVAKLEKQNLIKSFEKDAGKKAYVDYIGAIDKLSKFFGNKYIQNISRQDIKDFFQARSNELGRKLSRSTMTNYLSALNRVYELALQKGWINQSQIIHYKNNGIPTKRRPFFEEDEIKELRSFLKRYSNKSTKDYEKGGVKERTLQIRKLLRDYVDFICYSGLRPGVEMDTLLWSDLHFMRKDKKSLTIDCVLIKLRDGKTGERDVVCRLEILKCLERRLKSTNFDPDDPLESMSDVKEPIFQLPDGTQPKDLSGAFKRALIEAALLTDNSGRTRTLYSLRHNYATTMLRNATDIHLLAKNMGTSMEMIQKHYSHLEVMDRHEELSLAKVIKNLTFQEQLEKLNSNEDQNSSSP